jgi:hypothetical protein
VEQQPGGLARITLKKADGGVDGVSVPHYNSTMRATLVIPSLLALSAVARPLPSRATDSAPAAPAPAPPALGPVEWVEAAPDRGFNSPYLLRLPTDTARPFTRHLLVEPNNTGETSDDPDFHRRAAEQTAERAIGQFIAQRLNAPLLIPAFPRPKTDWTLYTHLLDRDTMKIRTGPLVRLDLQLLAMADDARARLRARGFALDDKLLLTGFSASGSFVDRFTLLHPERVRAAAAGGLNGMLMLPLQRLQGEALPYPIGLADFRKLTGADFNREAWVKVPQFLYMGATDDNDAVQFSDGYSRAERRKIYRLLGEKSNPDRWNRVQDVYREAGAAVTFKTYAGVGHWTDGPINRELAAFFESVLAAEP